MNLAQNFISLSCLIWLVLLVDHIWIFLSDILEYGITLYALIMWLRLWSPEEHINYVTSGVFQTRVPLVWLSGSVRAAERSSELHTQLARCPSIRHTGTPASFPRAFNGPTKVPDPGSSCALHTHSISFQVHLWNVLYASLIFSTPFTELWVTGGRTLAHTHVLHKNLVQLLAHGRYIINVHGIDFPLSQPRLRPSLP